MISQRTQLGLEIAAVGIAGGIMGDLLLRAVPWGLNVTLCVAALVVGGAVLVRRHGRVTGPDLPWLAITALLLGAAFLRRDAKGLATFDILALLLTLCLAAASMQGERIRAWRILDYIRAGVTGTVASGVGSLMLLFQDVDWKELPHEGRLKHARGVVLGLVIATPLLLVFAALFAAADEIFGNLLANLFSFDAEMVLSHAFLIVFWAALVAGYLRWCLAGTPLAIPPVTTNVSLGIVPVATVLGLLNGLFLLFVVVQLRYFFGGTSLIEETTGLTYAIYARRGFFELVTASSLVLPIVLLGDHVVRGAAPGHVALFRRLSGLLLALLAVVMASALQRMRLYVDAFGLSEDRLYATAFMVLLFGVFGWFAVTVLRGAPNARQRFAFGTLMQGLAVLAGLHILNPDAFIVRTNLNRPNAERPFDAKYAVSLGADAVPKLIAALPRLDDAGKCEVALGLLKRWDPDQAGDWRTWNWSRSRARRLVREQAPALRQLSCETPDGATT